MKKKGFIFLSMLLVLLVLGACSEKEPTSPDNKRDVKETEKKNDSTKEENSIMNFAVLGESRFTEASGYELTAYEWEDTIPATMEFVLISKDEIFTKEKKEKIKQLIEKKHFVFLVGKDVPFETAKEVFGYEIPEITIESNMPYSFLAFGYGYREKYKKNMPLFHGTNIDHIHENELDETIQVSVYEYLRTIKYPDLNQNKENVQKSSDLK